MIARVKSVAFQGIKVVSVDVQVQVSSELPAFTIVGLPDKAVAESRERVRAALHSIGLALPPKRLTVNLSPADIHTPQIPFSPKSQNHQSLESQLPESPKPRIPKSYTSQIPEFPESPNPRIAKS